MQRRSRKPLHGRGSSEEMCGGGGGGLEAQVEGFYCIGPLNEGGEHEIG